MYAYINRLHLYSNECVAACFKPTESSRLVARRGRACVSLPHSWLVVATKFLFSNATNAQSETRLSNANYALFRNRRKLAAGRPPRASLCKSPTRLAGGWVSRSTFL